MDSPFPLSRAELAADPPRDGGPDVRFPASLARAVIGQLTREEDLVLDPFAGYGTTAVAARDMRRRSVSIELLDERVAFIRRRLGPSDPDAIVVAGDARRFVRRIRGPVDLCLTSPPYMASIGHPENPLTGYRTLDGDYATYLGELEDVFRQVAGLLRPGGHLAINVADVLQPGGHVTPLVADIGSICARHLRLRQSVVLAWDVPPPGLTNDRLLVFRKA